jgi:hypothetical protein
MRYDEIHRDEVVPRSLCFRGFCFWADTAPVTLREAYDSAALAGLTGRLMVIREGFDMPFERSG